MTGVRTLVAQEQDWQTFLTLAAAEGWRVPQNEIAFHRRPGTTSAYALRRDEETIGFVTAVPHQKSGWIGNLLITARERGQGFGARLFATACDSLRRWGVQSVWLTASRQGEGLYRRRGFQPQARVSRWVRAVGGEGMRLPDLTPAAQGFGADSNVWQEARKPLLTHLSADNFWLARGDSIALLQQEKDLQLIGPWFGAQKASGALLEEIVTVAAPGKELVIDLLDRPETRKELQLADFICTGETLLMAAGANHDVRLERLWSLASLGSIG